jgi:hypothetical protein
MSIAPKESKVFALGGLDRVEKTREMAWQVMK